MACVYTKSRHRSTAWHTTIAYDQKKKKKKKKKNKKKKKMMMMMMMMKKKERRRIKDGCSCAIANAKRSKISFAVFISFL